MVDLRNFNLSGTLGAFSLIFRPAQCLPQAVVRNFNEIPIPVSKAFESNARFTKVTIRAVVLDKDDCFARPGEEEIAPEFKVRINFLTRIYLTTITPLLKLLSGVSYVLPLAGD